MSRLADLESVLAQAALGAAIVLPGLALLASRLFGWNVPFAAVVLGIGAVLVALAVSLVVPLTRGEAGGSPTPVESRE